MRNWFDFCCNYLHLRAFRDDPNIDPQEIVDFCEGLYNEAKDMLKEGVPFYDPNWGEDEDEYEDEDEDEDEDIAVFA